MNEQLKHHSDKLADQIDSWGLTVARGAADVDNP